MLGIDLGDIAIAAYFTLLWGALGALLWGRLNRIEAGVAGLVGKADIEVLRQEIARMPDKADVEAMVMSSSPTGVGN